MDTSKSFDQFLGLFPAAPRQGIKNGYNVLCPAHNDHDPSLSVTLNGYKILLHCKAGCPTPQILARLNLSESDLFLPAPQTPTTEAIYQYHDEGGKLLYEIVRYKPKNFKVRRPGSKGSWIWNLKDVRQVLYRLPDMTRAINIGDFIYITEGEKDCDNLRAIGLVATTNPFGAYKWRKEYSESLAGGDIVVVPDNDDEGRRHAISVLESLEGKAKSLHVLEIPLTAKDVTEWLQEGHSQEDLLSLETVPSSVYKNTNHINMRSDAGNSLKSEQVAEQVGTTSSASWGEYARKFDEIMRESGSDWQDKRDIAEQIGINRADRAYRSLLQRRRQEGKIRVHGRNPYLIQWINRDYKVTQLSSIEKQTFLDIKLPLNLHELAQIPPGSVVGVAGFVSCGKTSFLLATAELNALSQLMPVYYWYNEMSEAKMIIRCEDFPLLVDAQSQRRFFPVKQADFEFLDVIEPDGINLIDYLDRDDELYLIGRDIKQLQARLNNGIVVFALQKREGNKFGYGGLPSAKLSNLYIALDKVEEQKTCLCGKAEIIKCKDWEKANPVGMFCEYHTGGKHGKLFLDGEWKRSSK